MYRTALWCLIWLACVGLSEVAARTPAEDLFFKGYGQLKSRDYAAAVESFKKGLLLAPNDPLAHFYLAQSLWAQGATELAMSEYRASLSIDSQSSVAQEARSHIQEFEAGKATRTVVGKTYAVESDDTQIVKAYCQTAIHRSIRLIFDKELLTNRVQWVRINRRVFDSKSAEKDETRNEFEELRADCLGRGDPSLHLMFSFTPQWGTQSNFTVLESDNPAYTPGANSAGMLEVLDGGTYIRLSLLGRVVLLKAQN